MEKNELTNTIQATLCPRAVLIAYTYAQDKKYFLEQRSIDARGRMGEGHPVTVEFMNELVRNYSETYSGTPYGRLPSNLLYADTRKGSEEYIWYNPPGKRMMYFVENLGIENAEYNLPGIIYQAKEKTVSCPAVGLVIPDADSDEQTIKSKLDTMVTNEEMKIFLAESEDACEKAYNDMLNLAREQGADNLNAWANEMYQAAKATMEN